MGYTDVGKRLSSPTKCGRILYLSEPFLKNFHPKGHGIYKQETIDIFFEEALQFSIKERVVSPLTSYRQHHIYLVQELSKLKGLDFIFIPGVSPDLNEVMPDYVGHDIFSERFRLSNDILSVFNRVDSYVEEKNCAGLENFCIIAVAPFVLSIGKITRDKSKKKGLQLYLKHPLPHIFQKVNDWLSLTDRPMVKLEDVMTEKRLDQKIEGQKGIYEFSDFIYDHASSKKIFINYQSWPLEKIKTNEVRIDYSVDQNKQMLAAQWDTIFGLLGIKNPAVYMRKTSPFYDALSRFGSHKLDLIGGDKGAMRNADISSFGECHPSALNFLEGKIKYAVEHG